MKKYEEAKLEIVAFDAEDIITTSGVEECVAGPHTIDMGGEDLDD